MNRRPHSKRNWLWSQAARMNELDRLGAVLKRCADELTEAEFRQCMGLVVTSLQRLLDTEREHASERIVGEIIQRCRGGSG